LPKSEFSLYLLAGYNMAAIHGYSPEELMSYPWEPCLTAGSRVSRH